MGRARVRFGPFSFDTRTGTVIGSHTYDNLQQVDSTGGELIFSSLGGDVFAPSMDTSLPLAVEEDARNAAARSSTADQFGYKGVEEVSPPVPPPVRTLTVKSRYAAAHAASATVSGTAKIVGDNGSAIIFRNTDATTHTFTTDNTKDEAASTNLLIGTLGVNTPALAAESMHLAFSLAIAAGTLKMTLTPAVYTDETELTLTQNVIGRAGNTLVTVPSPNGIFVIQNLVDIAATASIRGNSSFAGTNATTLNLINTDLSPYPFTTDNTKDETTSTASLIGTNGVNTPALVAESLHLAFSLAITAGTLKMTLTPAVYTNETELLLTQNVPGAAGNTLISVPTGLMVQGNTFPHTPGVNENFEGGLGAADPYFTHGANPDIDLFMDGLAVPGEATISYPDGTYAEGVSESPRSLLPYHRLVISAVENNNGWSAAPADMNTITVYGLFGSNYKDQDTRNTPTAFSGPGPYLQGGYQQVTLGTLTRAAPVIVWDDRLKTTTTVGSDTSEAAAPFLTGVRLAFTTSAVGVIRVYIDAEREF